MLPRDAMTILAIVNKKFGATEKEVESLGEKFNQILPGYTYKGSVDTKTNLPSDATTGDLYTVEDEDYTQYAWDGEQWVSPQYPSIAQEQINSLF